jgi:hypothetical protein
MGGGGPDMGGGMLTRYDYSKIIKQKNLGKVKEFKLK